MRFATMIGALGFLACVALAAVPMTASANTGSGYKRMTKMEQGGMMHHMKHHHRMHHHKMMMTK